MPPPGTQDNGAVSLLATRDTGHSGGPTDFRGAFGCVRHGLHGLPGIDEYGSGDGELKLPLQKLTSISNIVPAGVQLELVGLRGASGAGGSTAAGGARRPDGAAQQPLLGRQLHSQRQKQGSQQRGPGRPERPPAAGAPAAAAAAPARTSPTKRAASEPAAAPAAVAAPPAVEGGAPVPAPKKMLKFRVKLNGKVVASAGGGPASQLPSPSQPQLAPEADTIGALDVTGLLTCDLSHRLLPRMPAGVFVPVVVECAHWLRGSCAAAVFPVHSPVQGLLCTRRGLMRCPLLGTPRCSGKDVRPGRCGAPQPPPDAVGPHHGIALAPRGG